MSREIVTDVLILGAGPTGMVAALYLSRLGVPCVIVDRNRDVAAHPKAHELSPRSVEILTGLGVPFAALDAEASPYEDSARVLFCGTLGHELGRIDLREGGADAKYFRHLRAPKPFLNLSQTALEEVLRDRVRRSPGVDLLLGHRWESMTEVGEEVRSSARAVDDAGAAPLRIRSRYVLCADGAGSPSRRALGIVMKGPERIQDFVNAYFEHDLADVVPARAKLYFALDPGCLGTFVAHHVEKRWVYHAPIFPPHERPEDLDRAELSRRIARALGRPVEGLRIRSIETWRMTAQVAERFRSGRAFLVGDAAHRFPPTGGLGMNSGIADAQNLCWKIAAVLQGRAAPALLDTYEAERRPVIERNCRQSVENYDRMFDIAGALGLPREDAEGAMRLRARLARWLPRLLMMVLFFLGALPFRRRLRRARRDPALRARVQQAIREQIGHFDRLGLDLGASYATGAILPDGAPHPDDVTEYHPSTRPGARLPHIVLDGGRSTHDLLDDRCFTLLVGPTGGAWGRALPAAVVRAGTVRVVPVELREALEIGPSGALLVRPDGHVAWRAREASPDLAATLREALAALCLTSNTETAAAA